MDLHSASSLASGGHPLIDIDLTAVIQLLLFFVLYLVANRMLFQPYLALRERRRTGIDGSRAEAERMTAEADSKLAAYEKSLAVARAKGNDEARTLRLEAIAHEKDVTERARATAQKATDEAQTKMRAQTQAARNELMPQADVLARKIASKLLGREVA